MKTLNMKRMNLIVALGFLGIAMQSVTALAQSRSGSPTSQSDTDVIAAEVKVTRDAMDEVIRRLMESQSQTAFHHADYKLKFADFSRRVAEAMARFESKLQNEIFPEIRFHIDEYNRIARSNAYSSEEKKDILANLEVKIKGMVSKLSKRYQAAIVDLHNVSGINYALYTMVNWSNSTWDNQSIVEKSRTTYIDCLIDYYSKRCLMSPLAYGGMRYFHLQDYENLFNKKIYPVLKNDCYSRSCISQFASDLILYLSLISKTLDKDIIFSVGSIQITLEKANLSNFSQIFLSYTQYPSSYEEMPFDIGDVRDPHLNSTPTKGG